jgi:hypothetical protein
VADQIKVFSTGSLQVKATLLAAIVLAAGFGWFAIRWQLGDMLGEFTSSAEPGASEIAVAAIDLAPSDPRGYWLAGAVIRGNFDPEGIDASVPVFEKAVRKAPYYYRWWTELGRANEQAGRAENAEKAFKRGVELAPEYAIPRWQLGNFYLRQGRMDDAIRELRVAAEHNSLYRGQVFSIAWNFFNKDPRQVEQFASDRPDGRAALAYFYAAQNRPDDALRVWNMLSEQQKAEFPEHAKTIAWGLFNKQSFIGAVEFSRQAGIDPNARPGAITNGDFESTIRELSTPTFDWTIARTDSRFDINVDTSVKHAGNRSLKATFRGYNRPQLSNVSQTIAVSPGHKYRLTFWVRTENLRSGSMPLIEIVNAADSKLLAASTPFPVGTNDWQQFDVEFTVPEDSEGINMRTTREACIGECPIAGIFWSDDFELARS